MNIVILASIPLFLLLLVGEAFLAHQKKRPFFKAKDSFGNLGTGILNQLAALFAKGLQVYVYFLIYEHFNVDKALSLDLWSDNILTWHGALSWFMVFILVDLLQYIYHRHSHEINLFWAIHIVHHSSEEYNYSVALRQPMFGIFVMILYSSALALLGIPLHMYLICNGLNLLYQFFLHTRFIKKLGPLENFMNTPSHHRVHHARQTKYLDCNYAGVFILWDKWFGTFKEEEEEPRYGVYPRFQSYDPVRANTMPLIELFQYMKMAQGLDKFRVLFSGPLWLYENFKKGKKLDVMASPTSWDKEALALFLISLGLALVVLFTPTIDESIKILVSALVLVALKVMGKKLDL